MNQYLVPGLGLYNESGTRQFYVPGFGLIIDVYAAGGGSDVTLPITGVSG